nr:alpha/beta hydrolase [Rikenellaceae bacterium]
MLHYKTFQKHTEAPWVVMLHGAGGSSEVWYRQVGDFSRHYNLLLIDLVGHGESSVLQILNKHFDFETAAEQVMEVVDHLNIRKAHYMGLSLGSIVVRVLAELHPERVESMVLAGAVTELSWESRVLLRVADCTKHIVPYRLLKWFIAKAIIPQRRYGHSMQLFLRNAKRLSFENFLRWLTLGDQLNSRIKRLFAEHIAIPTLYLMGQDDYLFLPQVQLVAAQAGQWASMVIVPEAGHVCNVDNKRFFNRVSLEFLRRLCASDTTQS